MKIHKKLGWLKEYIDLAKKILPQIEYIVLIRELFHQKDKVQRIHASLTQECLLGTYVLSFYTSFKKVLPKTGKTLEEKYSKIDILDHLAHELAHLEHWQHTPEHKILEAKLSILFMRHLLKSGYVSEEEEFRGKKTKKSRIRKSTGPS